MKKATVDLFTRIFSVLAPPPNMTVSQWADKYRRLSSESSAEPGRWRTSKAPYQREIMDAVCDMRVQKVVIMSAAQIGKTDALILNPIGYYMHYDPSPIMVMQPTIQMAETFSKDRLSPMLRDTPVLRDKVNDKSRNSGNTILQKIFPGGHVTMVGANSPSSLASRPIRILLADEIDRYPATAGNEGDPLLLAGKRLATFWNKKEVCVSTPTNKETSRIAVEFEHSTQEEWNVPCPACGAFTPLNEPVQADAGVYTHTFKKPFEYAGETYTTLTFDFEKMTGRDMVSIETEMQMNNEYCLAPEVSRSFQAKMAAKAAGIGSDVLDAMPIKDFNRITNAARSFLIDTGY